MPNIIPFKGLRYNLNTKDITSVVSPPYDVISSDEKKDLENKSKYNAVHVELPGQNNEDYLRASELFASWIREEVIIQDKIPSIYLAKHEFSINNKIISRYEIYASLELASLDSGTILPHEETRSGPKIDRLKLMEATDINFSPIMMLFRDPKKTVTQIINNIVQSPESLSAEITENEKVYLWVINDRDIIEKICKGIGEFPLLIADGHHRYETALTYRDENNLSNNGKNFIMVNCIDIQDPGLSLLPYHRGLQSLTEEDIDKLESTLIEYFEEVPLSQSSLKDYDLKQLEQMVIDTNYPCMIYVNKLTNAIRFYKISSKINFEHIETNFDPKLFIRCEGWVLYEGVFKNCFHDHLEQKVVYFHDLDEEIEDNTTQVLFLVKPFPLDLFEEIVDLGLKLPPKSTYFHPKVPTGFVYNSLKENI
ncbi:MAG: DUF1015 domain-containing protein [Dehalococcoidia bacterium]|jgi:uncharacterized protein (DUF1015 family)|nr:DUF1015 domain-containing protein [Dehalococcoidia bacterium]